MISAYEDALVKASVIKFTGKWRDHPRFKSGVETGDVEGQAKKDQEAMMGLGPKPKSKPQMDPERQAMYDKVDAISAKHSGNASDDSQTDPGIMSAAKNIGSKAV